MEQGMVKTPTLIRPQPVNRQNFSTTKRSFFFRRYRAWLADTSERENAFGFSVRPSCSLAVAPTWVSKWMPGKKVLHQTLIEVRFILLEEGLCKGVVAPSAKTMRPRNYAVLPCAVPVNRRGVLLPQLGAGSGKGQNLTNIEHV